MITEETVVELATSIKNLKEQNAHLNKYIEELVSQNAVLQGRLSDMKVTLQENKAMMAELMASHRGEKPITT